MTLVNKFYFITLYILFPRLQNIIIGEEWVSQASGCSSCLFLYPLFFMLNAIAPPHKKFLLPDH